MRVLAEDKGALRANPHPNPSPVGEGRASLLPPGEGGARSATDEGARTGVRVARISLKPLLLGKDGSGHCVLTPVTFLASLPAPDRCSKRSHKPHLQNTAAGNGEARQARKRQSFPALAICVGALATF